MKRRQSKRLLNVRRRIENLAQAELARAHQAVLHAQQALDEAQDALRALEPNSGNSPAELERRYQEIRFLEQKLQQSYRAYQVAKERLQETHRDHERSKIIHKRIQQEYQKSVLAEEQRQADEFGSRAKHHPSPLDPHAKPSA